MAAGSAVKRAKDETKVEPEASTSIFEHITVETKAGTYEFEELDGEAYDRCVDLATKVKTINGEEREVTDMVMLLRWLATKSSRTEGFGIEQINKLPFSARQKVLTSINRLYFPDELEDLARQLRFAGWTVTPPKVDDSGNA